MRNKLFTRSFATRLSSLSGSIKFGLIVVANARMFYESAAKAGRISLERLNLIRLRVLPLKRVILLVLVGHSFTSSLSVAESFTHKQMDELHRVCARKPYLWAALSPGRYLDCLDVDLYQQLQQMERLRDAELLLKSDKQFLAAYAEYTSKEKYNGH